jgi:hypothetical protein
VFVVVCFCCGHAAGASSGAAASRVKTEEVEDSIPSEKDDLDQDAKDAGGEGWKSQDEPGGTFDRFGLSPERNSPSLDQLLEDLLDDTEEGATIDEQDAGEEEKGDEEVDVHSEDQEFKLARRAERNYALATQQHGGMVSFAKHQAKRRRTVLDPREPKDGTQAMSVRASLTTLKQLQPVKQKSSRTAERYVRNAWNEPRRSERGE